MNLLKNENESLENVEDKTDIVDEKVGKTDAGKSFFEYSGEGFLKHTIKQSSINMKFYRKKADSHFGRMMFFTGLAGLGAIAAVLGTCFTEGVLKTTINVLSLSTCALSLSNVLFHFFDYNAAKIQYKEEKMKLDRAMDTWVELEQLKKDKEKDI